jgi:TatD DNase family protein
VLRAHDVAPRILKEERAHEVGGVMHSYSGGEHLVPVYRALGMCFSFAGPVTYPNARKPVAAAKAIPDELLLAETDAPDQAPAAHRGQRSEPAFVVDVIAGLAAARGVSARDIAELTTRNARRLFGDLG